MAQDQRPLLGRLSADTKRYLDMRRAVALAGEELAGILDGPDLVQNARESLLSRMAATTAKLHPRVKACRPGAPWRELSGLEDMRLFRQAGLSDSLDWERIDQTVAEVGQAAGEILDELEAHDLPMPPGVAAAPAVLEVKVTLAEVEPPIWRRLRVPNGITLRRLHNILQAACGWADYHLYSFEVAGTTYGRKDPDWDDDMRSDTGVRLNTLPLDSGTAFTYVYDFGDGWQHEILVEAVLTPEEAASAGHPPGEAVCLDGARAFPPENCGGPGGYGHLLEVLAHPDHEEHEDLKHWVGPYFDPEFFDREEVNLALAGLSGAALGGGRGAKGSPGPAEASPRESAREGGRRPLLVPLPDPQQTEILLRSGMADPAGPVRLRTDAPLDELATSRNLTNARAFMAAAQAHSPGGVKATATGNLSRAFALEVLPQLHFDERFEEWRTYISVRSEQDVWPLHVLRVVLKLAGLIRKQRDRFHLTKKGATLLAPERAGELQAILFHTFFGKFNLGYLDGMAEDPALQQAVPYILWMLRLCPAEWRSPAELREYALSGIRLREPEDRIGLYDEKAHRFELRVLTPLADFGLMESRQVEREPDERGGAVWVRREPEFRKAPLFDRLLAFERP